MKKFTGMEQVSIPYGSLTYIGLLRFKCSLMERRSLTDYSNRWTIRVGAFWRIP